MTEKFNLMKILREKEKNEKLKFEGAIMAFKLPDGRTGTATFCTEIGVALKLIHEAKVQERVVELNIEDSASKQILNSFPNQKEEKNGSTMFG